MGHPVRDSWDTLLRLLRGSDRESNEQRARHLRAVLSTTPWMMAATALNALLCALVLYGEVAEAALGLWLALLLLLCGSGVAGWRRAQRRSLRAVPSKLVWRATVHAALLGLLWAALPVLWLASVSAPAQLFVAVMVTGMMAGGAMALAMLPPAAFAYVLVICAGALIGLQRSMLPLAPHLQLLIFVYAVVLALASAAVMRLFTLRFDSEREAAKQSEVVGLLLRDFEETTADVLWEVERGGRFTQVSERLAQLFERPSAKVGQLGLVTVLQSLQVEGSQGVERLRQAMERGEAFRDQVVRVSTSQGTRWWSVTAKPLHDAEGRALGWRGVISDVTAERKSHQHLTYLAHFDSLTGLANRVSIRNRLVQAIDQATQPSGRRSALMCMDLDNFKAINDSLGHSVGDAVLQESGAAAAPAHAERATCAAASVATSLRSWWTTCATKRRCMQLAQRLVGAMRLPVQAMGMTVASGVSIGLIFLPEHARSVDEALVAADLALYAAKAAGRGRVQTFTEQLGASQTPPHERGARAARGAACATSCRCCTSRRSICRPGPSSVPRRWMRWQHPELGAVSPVEFIGIAEETGLIHNIGAWVLDRACADAQAWLKPLRIAVNVSASQVKRAGLVGELKRAAAAPQAVARPSGDRDHRVAC